MYCCKNTLLSLILILAGTLAAQTAGRDELIKGAGFIPTTVYSRQESEELLKLYESLRVVDVCDGMDMAGLPNTGLVERSIVPSWKDLIGMKHVFCGIALTVRYVPTQSPDRPAPGQDFAQWEGAFYGERSSECFVDIIQPGTALVIDDVEDRDIGTIGSNNIMKWREKGVVGVVTDASARDVDEVAKEGVPLYFRHVGRGIRPGRNELESVNRPVSIGGVLVCPGDVVVADGDGVMVVPRRVAREVALHARGILDGDKEGRRKLYERLGLPFDQTVK